MGGGFEEEMKEKERFVMGNVGIWGQEKKESCKTERVVVAEKGDARRWEIWIPKGLCKGLIWILSHGIELFCIHFFFLILFLLHYLLFNKSAKF